MKHPWLCFLRGQCTYAQTLIHYFRCLRFIYDVCCVHVVFGACLGVGEAFVYTSFSGIVACPVTTDCIFGDDNNNQLMLYIIGCIHT